jgi:hypothetical protein
MADDLMAGDNRIMSRDVTVEQMEVRDTHRKR